MRAGSLLLFGVAAYILVLVFTLPAARVHDYIEERVPGLSLSAVSGSVFEGRAGHVEYHNVVLGETHWRVRPLRLLTWRLEYKLEFAMPAGPGTARAGVTLFGNPYGRDIDLSLFPDEIINLYFPLGAQTRGKIRLLVEKLEVDEKFPAELAGKALWQDAAMLAPMNLVLGDISMDLRSSGDEIIGFMDEKDGPGLSGEVALTSRQEYRMDLLFLPDAGISSDAEMILESMATPVADGRYGLRGSGQW